ncbi:hypothetical protein HAX54_018734 [Datura stramonium]|uniref:Uncharacterized protein n=1 Tax=Datura stramonium TaxID=4076 RepID=A0ABS8UQP8_DATST|nr:hypothetical protein [Datura stramonium]
MDFRLVGALVRVLRLSDTFWAFGRFSLCGLSVDFGVHIVKTTFDGRFVDSIDSEILKLSIAARDNCIGYIMAIQIRLQRKIDSFIGRSLPFQLISCKTGPTIVESYISGDFHHFLADFWANR